MLRPVSAAVKFIYCDKLEFDPLFIVDQIERDINVATRMTQVIGSLEPFDPETDNWLAYTERLEQFFTVNRIADEKKVATLFNSNRQKGLRPLKEFARSSETFNEGL